MKEILNKLAIEEKNTRSGEEIICPYCEHQQDNETKYHCVSYWGEDSKKQIQCEHCGKHFWVEEQVVRTFRTTTLEWQEQEDKKYGC
jgi:C4-type Zn-finger protein